MRKITETIEEYNENPTEENYNHIIDEIADVFIMTYQHYLTIPAVRARVDFKISRTKERIEIGYYDK